MSSAATGKKSKLSAVTRYLGFGVGAFGMDLSYGLFYTYLSKYLTDVLGFGAGFMALVPPLARIWDGINDPMMGSIVDRTRSRLGKFRPWILIGAASNAVILTLLFTNPGLKAGGAGIVAYAAVMYVLWGMTNTMCDISYWSMVPALTNDPTERNIASSVPRLFSGAGQLAVAVATVFMVRLLGRTADGAVDTGTGYSRWALICGLILFAGALVTVVTTKEKGFTPPKEKFSFKKTVKVVTSNDQLLIFMLTAILYNTGWYMTTNMSLYFFDHVLGDETYMALFSAVCGAGQLVGLVLLPILSEKITRRRVIIGAMGVTVIGYIGMILFGAAFYSTIPFIFCAFIGGVGVGAMFVSETIMLADVVDYGEFKLGRRDESVVFSMKGFLQKLSYTIQSLVFALGLRLSDYNAAPDSPASQRMIVTLMFVLPPIFITVALLFYRKKYKLHGKLMDKVNDCVNARKLAQTEET